MELLKEYGRRDALEAIRKAVNSQKPDCNTLIIHSDLGSQYTSDEVEGYFKELGIRHSYSKKAYPYDNSPEEAFHVSLKKEEKRMNKYRNFHEARICIFEYIEAWYNRKRIHSRTGFITPQQCEDNARKVA